MPDTYQLAYIEVGHQIYPEHGAGGGGWSGQARSPCHDYQQICSASSTKDTTASYFQLLHPSKPLPLTVNPIFKILLQNTWAYCTTTGTLEENLTLPRLDKHIIIRHLNSHIHFWHFTLWSDYNPALCMKTLSLKVFLLSSGSKGNVCIAPRQYSWHGHSCW